MHKYLLAGIVVLLLLFIFSGPRVTNGWFREDNVSHLGGELIAPGSSNENVAYVGTFASREECEAALADTSYLAYTWRALNTGPYSGQCFGIIKYSPGIPATGYFSGVRAESFTNPAVNDVTSGLSSAVQGISRAAANTVRRVRMDPFSSSVNPRSLIADQQRRSVLPH